MNEAIEKFKEDVLKNYPRLKPGDKFKFSCHPGVSCFNQCCRDVNILLTPYDVLRMKNRLGLDSGAFLDRYTLLPIGPKQKLPVPVLKMNDDEGKTCPFVDAESGCTVYSDRPWPCRMYPLGLASPEEDSREEEFYFLLREDVCQGHEGGEERTILEWIDQQGIEEYNRIGEMYKEITLHPKIQQGPPLDPKKTDMFFTACYDLDKFRRFLFDTTFFQKFDVGPEEIEKIKEDDVELLKFGFRWVKFCLFNEPALRIKQEAAEAARSKFSK